MEPNSEFKKFQDRERVIGRLQDEVIKFYMPGFWQRIENAKDDPDALDALIKEKSRRLEKLQDEHPHVSSAALSSRADWILDRNMGPEEEVYTRFREYLGKDTKPLE